MGQLDLIAQGVAAGVPQICELFGHVGRVDLGPENPGWQPHTPPPLLDRDLGELALTATNHPEQPAMSC